MKSSDIITAISSSIMLLDDDGSIPVGGQYKKCTVTRHKEVGRCRMVVQRAVVTQLVFIVC